MTVLLLALASHPAPAQQSDAATAPAAASAAVEGQAAEVMTVIERMTKGIETAERSLQQLSDLEEGLGRLRNDVETILGDSRTTAEQLRPRAAAIKDQIEKLGPPPAKDAPPEAPAITAERARLNAEAAALDGAIKAAELTWVRARQLIVRITELRHALFTRNLLERHSSPLLPDLWRRVGHEAPVVGRRLVYLTNDWAGSAGERQRGLLALLAMAALVYLVARYATGRFTCRASREPPPSFVERAVSAAWIAPVRAAPALLAGFLVYGGLDTFDLLYPPWDGLSAGLIKGLMLLTAIGTLLSTVFAVREPHWRLFDLSDTAARRVCRLLQGVAGVYAIDLALTAMTRSFYMPLAFTMLQALATGLAYVALLTTLLLTPFAPATPGTMPRARHEPRWIKVPLWLLVAGIIAGALTGYIALARFAAQQVVMTGTVMLIAVLAFLAIRALTREPAGEGHPIGTVLESRLGLDRPRRQQLARLTELSVGLVLGLCALPVLMLQWGFSGADIRDWFKSLFFGFEIGQFRISLARILIGLVLFTVLLFLTRLVQRWLRERMLQQPRMDPGIANSIDTVAGYAGTAVAALVAVSYAGFDITNLAIVAGALSVGIGFGLQSIVNNFVSGLILLVERPIKVGDWVVIGNEQGNVRRISVRATEIETFDRASLIVPNSELITGRVLNRTHHNLLSRVIVKVKVEYTPDPDKVVRVLQACAAEHPLILKAPPPEVIFENFDSTTLDFSLRFLLNDLNRAFEVQSEMRLIILKAFRAQGISTPASRVIAPPPQYLILRVGVAYSADPDQVVEILREAAAGAHPSVLQDPPPRVILEGFGASSLDFAVHVSLDGPASILDGQSAVRIAILKALRAANIEVPYPQHDIHLRDLDGVRGVLARIGERAAAATATVPAEAMDGRSGGNGSVHPHTKG